MNWGGYKWKWARPVLTFHAMCFAERSRNTVKSIIVVGLWAEN